MKLMKHLFSSLFIAYEVLDIARGGRFYFPLEEFNTYVLIHACVSFVGVLWFWIRLRHYTYRKPFWFELKEIIRTLLILFIIELAIVAFSRLYVSRYFCNLDLYLCWTSFLPNFCKKSFNKKRNVSKRNHHYWQWEKC